MKSSDYIAKSDKIFHVHPTDRTNIKAIVSVIVKNKWSYIGAVVDDEASELLSVLKEEASKQHVCIGNTYNLDSDANEQQVVQFLRTLNNQKNYSIIVALTSHELTRMILKEASNQKVHDLTWITGHRSWPTTRPVPRPNSAAQGMFSILSRRSTPAFVNYLRSLASGTKKIENIWLREAASKGGIAPSATTVSPGATPTPSLGNATQAPTAPSCNYDVDPMCGMDQGKLKVVVEKMIGMVDEAACTIDAVVTVARALEVRQRCIESPDCNQDNKKFNDYVQQVDFTNSLTGSRISFTPGHSLNYTLYHVFNYQQNYSRITTDLKKELKAVDVGSWSYSPKTKPKLKISEDRIEWHGGRSKAPESRCHKVCRASQYKHLINDRIGAECCWECKQCPEGTYSDTDDLLQCKQCPETHTPSLDQKRCVLLYEDYVHWDHGGSLFILFLMVVGLCFSIYVAVVLFRNSETPVVRKAKSAVLCMFPFIIILFLLPIPLLGRPTETSCEGYRIFFLVALGVPLGVLIAKSHYFDNRCKDKRSENGDDVCTPRLSIACFVVLLHILLAVVLVLVMPSVQRLKRGSYTVFLECSYHSSHEFIIVLFYHMFLAVLVSIFSLNEIISEENNNEVKWISMAMFNWYAITFFYVVFMFGVHFHAKIIMLGLLCLLYTVNLFVLLYIPKWFIVVFRPEKNRSEVSPWTDYIKTQERVSERLSALDESPIMTRKEKTDDREKKSTEAKGLMTDTDI
ncbi:hypothetical protein QZH41_002310 [Actinostola sp. cb2023]|nr:hypothetical protein QZH41_002310 [Actinostola sp. cb2023]